MSGLCLVGALRIRPGRDSGLHGLCPGGCLLQTAPQEAPGVGQVDESLSFGVIPATTKAIDTPYSRTGRGASHRRL